MAQDIVQLRVCRVDNIHIRERGEGPAGEGIDKVMSEHISAVMQHKAEREGKCS